MVEIKNCGIRRRQRIDEADRLTLDAVDLLEEAEASESARAARAKRVRAAKAYTKSAVLYRQAGLGLMALASYEDAADVYADNGDTDWVKRCQACIVEIEPYIDEDG